MYYKRHAVEYSAVHTYTPICVKIIKRHWKDALNSQIGLILGIMEGEWGKGDFKKIHL